MERRERLLRIVGLEVDDFDDPTPVAGGVHLGGDTARGSRRNGMVVLRDHTATVRVGLDLQGGIAGVLHVEHELGVIPGRDVSGIHLDVLHRQHRLGQVDSDLLLRVAQQGRSHLPKPAGRGDLRLARLTDYGGAVGIRPHQGRLVCRNGQAHVGSQALCDQVGNGGG